MKIVEPKVTHLESVDLFHHIATCGRICYNSTRTDKNGTFVTRLIQNNHLSVFRHHGMYFRVPISILVNAKVIEEYKYDIFINYIENNNFAYISCNYQTFYEKNLQYLTKYEISKEEARKDIVFRQNKMIYETFIIETGIDITRELNRVSPNAICEQSTRYVDFNKKLGIRFKYCHWMNYLNLYRRLIVKAMCKIDEWFYKISRSKYGLNLKPEDARWCLFLDTQSKVAYTYTIRQWEHIINLRVHGTTGKPHPDAKIVCSQIEQILNQIK